MERRGPFVVNWASCARRAGLALLCAARELDDRLREHVALDRTAKLVEIVPLGKPQLAIERVDDERAPSATSWSSRPGYTRWPPCARHLRE